MADAGALALELAANGVVGVTIAWADNNGIPRSRTVPVDSLPQVAQRGVGITALFAVFDTHDAITFAHEGLSTPSGDVRLIPELRGLTRLAGQRALAWVPGRQVAADGSPWPYDQRGVLEAQVQAAAAEGLEIKAGYEMEFVLIQVGDTGDSGEEPRLAHHGPAYSPHALLAVDEFVVAVLADLTANGVP
ncbi:MAG: glutamine synthetase, partial [Pseudonocardiaceae bacterium]